MSHWTSAVDLRDQVRKRWDKGELLSEWAAPGLLFPLRLVLRLPTSSELSERFDDVRAWAAGLQQGARAGYRLVMRDVRHRVIGQNSLPDEAWVDSLDDALRLITKGGDARTFERLLAITRQQQPALLPWVQQHPMRTLMLADPWPQLLSLVHWMTQHPRPGMYLREVDLPGIHSKFVEGHRNVLAELLDQVLPVGAIDAAASGPSQFARRYGFRDKPMRLRFRLLDPMALKWVAGGDGDYTVSQITFDSMHPAVEHVFVTENEVNFLSFPPAPKALVVFGAGYGFDGLANVGWMSRCSLHYWGDIDTHGFAILDQLRVRHPHARSLLMDRQTLLAHQPQWTSEPQPTLRDLPRLSLEESTLYDELRWLRLADHPLRLEQERVGFGWVSQAVALALENASEDEIFDASHGSQQHAHDRQHR